MLEWLRRMIRQHYEMLAYLFFGGLSTLLNLVLYLLFKAMFGYEAANSWGNVLDTLLCILFAYGTNRTWVFRSKTRGAEALAEFAKFFTCRLGTLVMDAVIMFVGGNLLGPALVSVQWLGLWGFGVKVFSNVLVIVFNYIFSKLIIFKDKGNDPPA